MDFDLISQVYPVYQQYAVRPRALNQQAWATSHPVEVMPKSAEYLERRVAQACYECGLKYALETDAILQNDPISDGYYNSFARRIVVRPTQPLTSIASCAVHEFTHAIDRVRPQTFADFIRGESHRIEAYTELTSFVVCRHFGLDTTEKTALYLTGMLTHRVSWPDVYDRAHALIPRVIDRLEQARGCYAHPNRVTR